MALDSTQLRYFIEVGTLGSIKAASETLHITQSALSRRMVKLETDIGKPLFVRSHLGVELTDVGRDLMRHAIELMSLLDRIAQIGQAPNSAKRDSVRMLHLGMVASASALLLEKVVVRFAQAVPDVLLRVEGLTYQPLGALGLQIKVGRSDKPSPAVETVMLWKDALLIVAPKASSLGEIRKMTYVEAAKLPEIRAAEARVLAEHGLRPERRIEVWPANEAIRVIDKDAYTILPYSMLAAHDRLGDFKIIPSRYERLTLDLTILKSASKRPEYRALKSVIQQAANEFLDQDRTGFLTVP